MTMSKFAEKLRLKEMADEDMYFARRDLALIKALHKEKLAKVAECGDAKCKAKVRVFEKRFDQIRNQHKKKPRKLFGSLNTLLDDIKKAFKQLG